LFPRLPWVSGHALPGYEWKISGCSEQGINAFDDQLQEAIINRISQQGKIEDCIEEDSN